MKYKLTITPAMPPSDRHAIEDILKVCGYDVVGGGTNTDMSECDISFDGGDLHTMATQRKREKDDNTKIIQTLYS